MKAQSNLAVRKACCRFILTTLVCAFAFLARAQKMPESGQGPSVAPTFILGNPSDYAGIDRCRSCHKPEYREYSKTAHSKVTVPGKDYISGCEVCHGPGKAHADAIEAAEGDEGKTQRALSEHPIFSFAVNQKVTAALKQFPVSDFSFPLHFKGKCSPLLAVPHQQQAARVL